jgi:peptidyl-prolyl cis-trans isomerase B (cyclophilin B)
MTRLTRTVAAIAAAFGLCAIAAAQTTPPGTAKMENVVVIETSQGTIKVELFPDKAPITVKNFLSYVDDKHYDGLIFHRVIKNFMVQGGGMDASMVQKKTKDPIKNEASNGLKNDRGTLAMARTSVPDSATSQFFINTKDNGFLNKAEAQDGVGYCVFGKVIEGMDVVDKIEGSKTGRGDVPVETISIKSITKAKK